MLLAKTVVQPSKDCVFCQGSKSELLNVTLFKNKKIGTLSDFQEVSDTSYDYQIQNDQHPVVSSIQNENIEFLHEIEVHLSQNDLL